MTRVTTGTRGLRGVRWDEQVWRKRKEERILEGGGGAGTYTSGSWVWDDLVQRQAQLYSLIGSMKAGATVNERDRGPVIVILRRE